MNAPPLLAPLLLVVAVSSLLLPPVRCLQPVALLTGATGRTGQMVTDLLLDGGFRCKIFCRDESRAREQLGGRSNVEYCPGDLSNLEDVRAAFDDDGDGETTHVVFMAGGDNADYRAVNYHAVRAFANEAVRRDAVRHFVVVSTAWATKPYSFGSLLFNSMFSESVPMASHYLGEQALRKAAATNPNLSYVILRATGLNDDERYAKKYPEAASMGLTYQQGDSFDFFGIAGRPGMSRSQLANAVAAAVDVEGRYTVEVTGSGDVAWSDSSVYGGLVQDGAVAPSLDQEEAIYEVHVTAVKQLKNAAIAASVAGLGFIAALGLFQGILLVLLMDAAGILVWRTFLANKQAL